MIRLLFRIADRRARRALAGYLAIAVGDAVFVAAMLVSLIPVIRALFSGTPATALPLLIPVALFGVVAGALEVAATIVGQRLGGTLILRMHMMIGERTLRLPLGWFNDDREGALSRLATRGVVFAANASESILRPVLLAVMAPLVVACAVLAIAPAAGACMLIGVVAVVTVWLATRRRGDAVERAVDHADSEAASRVLEFALAQPAVRAAGPDSLAERSVRAAVRGQRVQTRRALAARGRGMLAYGLVAYAAMLLTVAAAARSVFTGDLDAATFVAVLTLQVIITWFAMHGLPFGEGIDLATRTLQELDRLCGEPVLTEPQRPGAVADASIEFEHVDFSYLPGHPVIRDVTFTVPDGTMTAIVGPSGSGKTTLARLAARFFDVGGGAIRIGGQDVRALGTAGTLSQISMVFQQVYLFEGSLRENILLGNPSATAEQVADAVRRAGVDELAARLPDGLDSAVGEGGSTLSGGERQRVSIARALLKDAPIVLLDEATAALDVENEALVQVGLDALAGKRTRIVVAHRLQTIRDADQIVVLTADGGVEAVGTHESLLAQNGTYRGFWAERTLVDGWTLGAAGRAIDGR